MKKLMAGLMAVLAVGIARADVHFNGLYHNNTNLNPQTETIPSFPDKVFLELQYDQTNVVFHFLTESPAGNSDESVEASIRIYSNQEQNPAANWQANIVLKATNTFHGAGEIAGSTLDLWRVDWTPPHGFSGNVYYAPRIVTKFAGSQTDQQYLLPKIGSNTGGQWGDNGAFYTNLPQSIGDSPVNLDYSFNWTNVVPLDWDYFYFNSTNSPLPEEEEVPGLGGVKFLDYHYSPTEASYVYLLTPKGGVQSMQTRFYFLNGGGEIYRGGEWVSNVVISHTNQFHGLPASGSVTLDVWRTAFYPPSGWANETLYYAHQVTTPLDGTMWLVTDPDGSGVNLTNNFAPPQYFNSDSYNGGEWTYSPTAGITRVSVTRDYLYHNNPAQNPTNEAVPAVVGKTFLTVDYATTTTIFRIITDHPANAFPGESVTVQLRTYYVHPQSGAIFDQWQDMNFEQNLVIDSAPGFHGLPSSGSRTVDLWRVDWPQPLNTNDPSGPLTNAVTIYYAPYIKTTFGADNYQTDATYLLATGTDNNYPVEPQRYGGSTFGVDYSYVNQYFIGPDADGDGMPDAWENDKFGTTTNGAAGNNDDDPNINIEEYIADTDPTNGLSFFGEITNVVRAANTLAVTVEPTSTARVYDAYVATNLVNGQSWMPVGLNVQGSGGLVTLIVTNGGAAYNFLRSGVALPP